MSRIDLLDLRQAGAVATLLGDRELARDLIQSWGALSYATHYHTYDLSQTATELEHWLAPVAELISRGPDT